MIHCGTRIALRVGHVVTLLIAVSVLWYCGLVPVTHDAWGQDDEHPPGQQHSIRFLWNLWQPPLIETGCDALERSAEERFCARFAPSPLALYLDSVTGFNVLREWPFEDVRYTTYILDSILTRRGRYDLVAFGALNDDENRLIYLLPRGSCDPVWLEAPEPPRPSYYVTTLRGRFLSFGYPGGDPPQCADRDTSMPPVPQKVIEHYWWKSTRRRCIDSLIAASTWDSERDTLLLAWFVDQGNPVDSLFLARFNSAVPILFDQPVDSANRLRILKLYLTSVFAADVVYIIRDAMELDRFYGFVWTRETPNLSEETWEALLRPGVRDGSFLKFLPEEPSPRPGPAPSVILDRHDGGWFTGGDEGAGAGDSVTVVTLFSRKHLFLLQLRMTQDPSSGRIERATIERFYDLFEQFSGF